MTSLERLVRAIRIVLSASPMIMPISLWAQQAPTWDQVGVLWTVTTPEESHSVVDETRVAEQKNAGCDASTIRFGDTAPMRGFETGADWPRTVRDAVSSAMVSDGKDDALEQLKAALSDADLTSVQRYVIENRMILTALQFDDAALAKQLLATVGEPADLPGPLLSDRLFWQAYLSFGTATPEVWATEHSRQLERALEMDPTSFQVRFWRIAGWLNAHQWEEVSCTAALRTYSDMLLDMSEAGSCSLMVGHLSNALTLELSGAKAGRISADLDAWMTFTDGLLAVISLNTDFTDAFLAELVEAPPSACAPLLASELARIGAVQ